MWIPANCPSRFPWLQLCKEHKPTMCVWAGREERVTMTTIPGRIPCGVFRVGCLNTRSVTRSPRVKSSSVGRIETDNWDAARYNQNASYVYQLAGDAMDLLNPQPGESILDLGCGEGSLSKALQDSGCHVIGIDGSQSMVDATKAAGVEAYRMDGQVLTFDQEFDAVFSNAAMHWMSRDPKAVVQGVRRALRPGGRFVSEFGGHGNIAAIVTALHAVLGNKGVDVSSLNPWYFPSKEEYQGVLEGEGFSVDEIVLIPRATLLPAGLRPFLETFGSSFLQDLPSDDQNEVIDEVVDLLKPILQRHDGMWTADYVRLRFKATLKE